MARYVIVEVDDDAAADALVARLAGKSSFRVRWVFQKPRKFCECGPKITEHVNTSRLIDNFRSARGERFGWWVHDECGRPRKTNYQMPRNLLPDAPEGPSGWMFMSGHTEGGFK